MQIKNIQSLKEKTKQIVDESLRFWETNNIELILENTRVLEQFGIENNYSQAYSRAQILLSAVDTYYSNYNSALERLFLAEKIARDNQETEHLSDIYNSIGRCYGMSGNHEKAIEYFDKALGIDQNSFSILMNLGVSLLRTQKHEEALQTFFKALNTDDKDSREEKNQAHIHLNIGSAFFMLKSYDSAKSHFLEALPYAVKYEQRSLIASIHFSLAEIYCSENQNQKAINELSKAEGIYQEINSEDGLMRVYERLAFIYKDISDHEKSFQYLWEYSNKMKNLFHKTMNEKIDNLEKKHQKEQEMITEELHEWQNKHENAQKEIKNLQAYHQTIPFSAHVGIFSENFQKTIDLALSFHDNRSLSVLIQGETGTGKEIIAKMIHYGKEGSDKPFISLNCSSISPDLFESEFFGYSSGSFTGGLKEGKIGKFELAQGGTIFLDEIGDMPVSLQPKLLRVLQEKEFYPIGSDKKVDLDVRIIAATNKNLRNLLNSNDFRSDLYFRLSTGVIEIQPLRKRKNEIIPLARFFMQKYSDKRNKFFTDIEENACRILQSYSWPGNIRELENCIERIVLLNNDEMIRPEHLHFLDVNTDLYNYIEKFEISLGENPVALRDILLKIINKVILKCNGNKAKAAEYLKISRKTIYNYIEKDL
jgi:transcriptional regulator with PAS, ATPase and Fis domain